MASACACPTAPASADATLLHSGLNLLRAAPLLARLRAALDDAAARTRGFGDYYGYGVVAQGKRSSTSRST